MNTAKQIIYKLNAVNESSKEVRFLHHISGNIYKCFILFNDRLLRDSMTSKVASFIETISKDATWMPLYDPSDSLGDFVYNIIVTIPSVDAKMCSDGLTDLFIQSGFTIK